MMNGCWTENDNPFSLSYFIFLAPVGVKRKKINPITSYLACWVWMKENETCF